MNLVAAPLHPLFGARITEADLTKPNRVRFEPDKESHDDRSHGNETLPTTSNHDTSPCFADLNIERPSPWSHANAVTMPSAPSSAISCLRA
jgi:hypothetical protein